MTENEPEKAESPNLSEALRSAGWVAFSRSEGSGVFAERHPALAVVCPKCHANSGEPCGVAGTTDQKTLPHPERVENALLDAHEEIRRLWSSIDSQGRQEASVASQGGPRPPWVHYLIADRLVFSNPTLSQIHATLANTPLETFQKAVLAHKAGLKP